MQTTTRERRSICRECSRGSDAPHLPGCRTALRAEFTMAIAVRSYWMARDGERRTA